MTQIIDSLWSPQEDFDLAMSQMDSFMERSYQRRTQHEPTQDEGEPTRPSTSSTVNADTSSLLDANSSGYCTNPSSVSTSQPRGSEGGQKTRADQQPTPHPGLTPRQPFYKGLIDLLKEVFDVEPYLGLLQSVSEPTVGEGITSHTQRIARCLSLIFKATDTENSQCTVKYTAGPQEFIINIDNIVRGFDCTVIEFREEERDGMLVMGMRIAFQWTDNGPESYSAGDGGATRFTFHTTNVNDLYGNIIRWLCILKNIKPEFMTDYRYPDPLTAFDGVMYLLYEEWRTLTLEVHQTVTSNDVLGIWAMRSAL